MTTLAKVAPAQSLSSSTPARLSRAGVCMWMLIGLSCVFIFFIGWQTQANLQAFSVESNCVANGIELVADLRSMAADTKVEFATSSGEDRVKARSDYNTWRDAAVENIETAIRLPPITDPFLFWKSDTDQSAIYGLKSEFTEYQNAINAARRNKENASVEYTAANSLMANELLPDAANLFERGHLEFEKTAVAYENWHDYQIIAIFVVGSILAAFISYQYQFMVRRGKPGSPAFTCLSLLACAVVFSYAYLGMRTLDTHAQRVIVEISSSIQAQADAIDNKESTKPIAPALARETADRVANELRKADARIAYLQFAPFFFFLGGLFFQIAVNRSSKDYR